MVKYLRYVVSDWNHLLTICQIHHAESQTPLSLDAPVNLNDSVSVGKALKNALQINITQHSSPASGSFLSPQSKTGDPPCKPSDVSVPVSKTSGSTEDDAGRNGRNLNPPQFRINLPGQDSSSGGHSPKLTIASEPPSPKPVNKQLSALVMTKEFKRDISGGSRSPSDEQGNMLGVSLGMQCIGHNASSLSLLVQYSSSSEDELDLDDDIENIDLEDNVDSNGERNMDSTDNNVIPDRELQKFSISGDKCGKWAEETDTIYAAIAAKKHDDSAVDRFMTVLIRLRLAISRLVTRGLFPYNAEPLIKLLEQCEKLYET